MAGRVGIIRGCIGGHGQGDRTGAVGRDRAIGKRKGSSIRDRHR
jgi:hypothetical protein